jgi:hypothetical protein
VIYGTEQMSKLIYDVAKQKENLILESLGDLITRGLLVIEETQPVLTGGWSPNEDKYEVKLEQKIRIVLKDKEYIEKLEKENADYKERLETMRIALDNKLVF